MDEMTLEEFINLLQDIEDDHALLMDGFDDCVIGAGEIAGNNVIIYDWDLVIEKLMSQGMDFHEAVEFYSFNQTGFMGSGTPVMQTVKIIK